ncbi:hypothetical protein [Amphritea sp.]|uniref:hypothetical protein n=1 Tax=Amphritea sp. TaxID=1872502 RepID=UPI003A8F5131
MASNIELFIEQLNKAVELIDETKSAELDSHLVEIPLSGKEDLDTQSLLARCENVCNVYDSDKPTIRIIHTLVCNSGEIVTKCLSAMPNTFLLNNVHPYCHEFNKENKNYSSSDISLLSKHAGIPKQKELADRLFKKSIDELYQHVENIGGVLVLCDYSYGDFNPKTFAVKKNSLVRLLEDSYTIKNVLLVSNPLNYYASLKENDVLLAEQVNLDNFFKVYLDVLEQFEDKKIYSFEKFISNPTEELETITKYLGINYSDFFEDIYGPFSNDCENVALDSVKENTINANNIRKINDFFKKSGIDYYPSNTNAIKNCNQESKTKNYNIPEYIEKKGHLCITVAGMRHSGSTALFNILRLAIQSLGVSIESGYSEHLKFDEKLNSKKEVFLIKTHEIRDDIRDISNIVITTVRDLRDSVASAQRRDFDLLNDVGGVVAYAKYNRSLHDSWEQYSDYIFNYESFMRAPREEIRKLLSFLGLADVSVEYIHNSIMNLPIDKYEITLLSPEHITDPERLENYKTTLSVKEINIINKQNFSWLKRFGYK